MSTCYRCETVQQRDLDGVGVCQQCGALACSQDGARDAVNLDFYCGMCIPSRLLGSSGIPPTPRPGPGPGGGGGLPSGGGGPESPGPGGGTGGAAVPFADTADFAERFATIAEQSAPHRAEFRRSLRTTLEAIDERGRGERAEALRSVSGFDWDESRISETAELLANQVDAARRREAFDEELFADALGVAAWSIGLEPGQEPTIHQLRLLGDPRLQLAIGTVPLTATA